MDLPLSRPFFKLMCSYPRPHPPDHVTLDSTSEDQSNSTHEDAESEEAESEEAESESDGNNNDDGNENSVSSSTQSNQQQTSRSSSSVGSGNGTASAGRARGSVEAGLKEAELLVEAVQAEISKDGGSKDVTLEELSVAPQSSGCASASAPWFSGILDNEDFAEVNPFRAKFLDQLEKLVHRRDAIMADSTLESGEKERRLENVTLPGEQENLPGMKLEDLW